jgi:hypothetical protein
MTQADLAERMEASIDGWFQRYGPVGFILRYSFTLTATAFLLWNLLLACTNAGLAWYWHGTRGSLERVVWAMLYFASLLVATGRWLLNRQRLRRESAANSSPGARRSAP